MPLRIQRGTLAPRPARGLDILHGDNATLQQRQLIFIPDARVDVTPAAVGLEFVQVAIPLGEGSVISAWWLPPADTESAVFNGVRSRIANSPMRSALAVGIAAGSTISALGRVRHHRQKRVHVRGASLAPRHRCAYSGTVAARADRRRVRGPVQEALGHWASHNSV